jgi:hypothetical protein
MGRTERQYGESLAWLRYVLNPQTEMPAVTDWAELYAFAGKQALTGIAFPEQAAGGLGKDLRIQWVGTILQIEQQNRLLNRRVGELFDLLERDGFRCCLLKGQGNAEMYPNPLLRCAGDIDIWVDADEQMACQYVRDRFPDEEATFKHIHFPLFDDAPIDVHVTPLKFRSTLSGKRLQRWIEKNKEEQFAHHIRLTGEEREVCVPTDRFNVVYQLGHMLIHLFDKGLGLRQVVDYLYLLRGLDATESERGALAETIENLGMGRFCRAIMWIERDVLGLSAACCLVEPCERSGRRLLRDILRGGNFGHYNQRYEGRKTPFDRGWVRTWRNLGFLVIAPREGAARLLKRMGTAVRYIVGKITKHR